MTSLNSHAVLEPALAYSCWKPTPEQHHIVHKLTDDMLVVEKPMAYFRVNFAEWPQGECRVPTDLLIHRISQAYAAGFNPGILVELYADAALGARYCAPARFLRLTKNVSLFLNTLHERLPVAARVDKTVIIGSTVGGIFDMNRELPLWERCSLVGGSDLTYSGTERQVGLLDEMSGCSVHKRKFPPLMWVHETSPLVAYHWCRATKLHAHVQAVTATQVALWKLCAATRYVKVVFDDITSDEGWGEEIFRSLGFDEETGTWARQLYNYSDPERGLWAYLAQHENASRLFVANTGTNNADAVCMKLLGRRATVAHWTKLTLELSKEDVKINEVVHYTGEGKATASCSGGSLNLTLQEGECIVLDLS